VKGSLELLKSMWPLEKTWGIGVRLTHLRARS
jgi:hypothetical protein